MSCLSLLPAWFSWISHQNTCRDEKQVKNIKWKMKVINPIKNLSGLPIRCSISSWSWTTLSCSGIFKGVFNFASPDLQACRKIGLGLVVAASFTKTATALVWQTKSNVSIHSWKRAISRKSNSQTGFVLSKHICLNLCAIASDLLCPLKIPCLLLGSPNCSDILTEIELELP